jgi:hypothetical protein
VGFNLFKGCQKKMILLRDTKSKIFDEVYFVLKSDADIESDVSESDMIKEAGRIIDANMLSLYYTHDKSKKTNEKHSAGTCLKWFITGGVSCGALTGIILWIIGAC